MQYPHTSGIGLGGRGVAVDADHHVTIRNTAVVCRDLTGPSLKISPSFTSILSLNRPSALRAGVEKRLSLV
jgi:hypothetical protein